jgi:hypothetical protein
MTVIVVSYLEKLNAILMGSMLQVPTSVPSSASSILKAIYDFLVSANPFILIILGVVIFFAGKLAKFVGIILVILGIIHLALPYIMKII